jgi:hypothetical protein
VAIKTHVPDLFAVTELPETAQALEPPLTTYDTLPVPEPPVDFNLRGTPATPDDFVIVSFF